VCFAAVALAGQGPPLLVDLLGGGLAPSTSSRLGWLYTLAFHRIEIDVVASAGGRFGAVAYRVSIAFLLGTAFALWMLYRAGRAAATRAGGGGWRRALAGALISPAYALPIWALTLVVELRLRFDRSPLPPTLRVHGVPWQAFVLPLAIAAIAGAAGGFCSSPREGWARRSLAGGWLAFATAIGLAAAGFLVVAAVRPSGTSAYARFAGESPARAALVLGHHALLLPNQSLLLLVPSIGGCVGVTGEEGSVPLLCPGAIPASGAVRAVLAAVDVQLGGLAPPGPATRPTPPGYLLFGLAPAIAAVMGGRRASRDVRDRRAALLSAGGAALVFAGLVALGSAAAGLSVRATGAGSGSATLGASPFVAGAFALAWALLGGAVGALTSRPTLRSTSRLRQEVDGPGEPDPDVPELPDPPRPTSV
jgi:hypothetical protein